MSALIIPCFLRTPWDVACLDRLMDSVRDQTTAFEHVYLVDDASPLAYVPKHACVDRIVLPQNGGPARARNVAIQKALAAGYKHLLFTDHDCILDPAWNAQMTAFLERTDFAAVGGMTYAWGKTLLDRYHDVNGTLVGKWLSTERWPSSGRGAASPPSPVHARSSGNGSLRYRRPWGSLFTTTPEDPCSVFARQGRDANLFKMTTMGTRAILPECNE